MIFMLLMVEYSLSFRCFAFLAVATVYLNFPKRDLTVVVNTVFNVLCY